MVGTLNVSRKPSKWASAAIDLGHQQPDLVDMEVVVLGIFVPNRPLLRVPQLHLHIRASFIEDLAVNEEFGFLRTDENVNVRRCAIGLEHTVST